MSRDRDRVVLGVDPGLTRCGIGVIAGAADRPRLVAAGCARTVASTPLADRLLTIHGAVCDAIEQHRPDAVAVERVLFSANVRTAMATGQAAGVALLAAAAAGVEVTAYSPNEVKQTVAGVGDASKDAVARLVAAQLSLAAPPTPVDVTDALAVALTHLARGRLAVLAAETPAARQLAGATEQARAGGGGWEAHLARRGLLPGSGDGRPR